VIGLYDSGLGGLTVLAALRAAGVDQDVVYFADYAHLPYGDKTDSELHGFLAENLALLGAQGVDAVVAACNTSCAVARKRGWPATPFPVLDLIDSAAREFTSTPYRRVAVVATIATVRSGAYGDAIRAVAPHVRVDEIAAPKLVPIVESGDAGGAAGRDAVAEITEQIASDVNAVVYGCTHYPLLDRWFAAALGAGVARVDPAHAQAHAASALIARLGLAPGGATTTYVTNGDPVAFERGLRRLNADVTGNVRVLCRDEATL
jgi:glutamate racemase